MTERLVSFFIPDSENYSFDIILKSKTLLTFSLIISSVMPLLWVLLITLLGHSVVSILSLFLLIVIISNISALFILRSGRYYAAANTFVLSTLAGYSLYLLFGTFKFDIGVIVSGYQLFIFIIFSALFCKKAMTLLLALLVLVIQMTALYSSENIASDLRTMAQINFAFELIIVTAICYLLMSITDKTLQRLKEEADNREHLERTRELLASVSEISGRLNDSFSVMSSATENFSNNAQNQAAAAEEITATVEEISAGVESVAHSAGIQMNKIEELVSKLSELSEQISIMKDKINEARIMTSSISAEARTGESSLKSMEESMNSMNQRSMAMAGIINIINDISDRINLLSLNAAIEAARAGNAGRGFAVVADEISKLADQTSNSVKEISSLIKAGESDARHGLTTVNSVVSSLSKIIGGVAGINNMVESMSRFMETQIATNQTVNNKASDVKERSQEIQNATEVQKNATGEIVKSIATISDLTQDNAAGAEEMSANAHEILKIASSLNEKVEKFRNDEA